MSLIEWDIWVRIETNVQKYCRRKWNGHGDDVASQTKIIIFKKIETHKFTYRTDEDTRKYAKCIARRIARDIVSYRKRKLEISIDDVEAGGLAVHYKLHIDERIEIIWHHSAAPVRRVIEKVLSGENITTACLDEKISYAQFIRQSRDSYYQAQILGAAPLYGGSKS